MSLPASDRQLLFAALALQTNLVGADKLGAGLKAWAMEPSKPLADVLADLGTLSRQDRDALEQLVDSRTQPSVSAATEVGAFRANLVARQPGVPASRFRVVRLHARGGLGEVSVAVDEQLGRQVALKQMRERCAEDEASRVRFLREAEITGRLEHPGIVPVYGLDVDERGRPRYAMRFIHGDSLEQAIAAYHKSDPPRPDPTDRALELRKLLTCFVDVCNTIAYAHSRDVIHRDIKPANVMLGGYGETLVVDWGLARVLGQEPDRVTGPSLSDENGSDVTQLGQVVGTPAYMPPEQARGEHDRVGPAADVFALGATLYCLLTGEPPYSGQSGDLLVQAAKCEILPARRVNPQAPAALAAVCHKAMAARPEDRYASAGDLAAEVERWLADEPVRAYRDPPASKVRRWAKRNRTLVVAGMALLAASVMGLSLGLWAVERERSNTASQRDEAKENLKRALVAEKEAKKNFDYAAKAVDECFGLASEEPMLQGDGMKKLRGLLLKRTLPFYRNFRQDSPDDPDLAFRQVEYLHRVAHINAQIGSKAEAQADIEQAREALERLTSTPSDDPLRLLALARLHLTRGNLFSEMSREKDALASYQESLKYYRQMVALEPKNEVYRTGVMAATGSLGNAYRLLADHRASQKHLEEARTECEALVKEHPTSPQHREALAHTLTNLGVNAIETNRPTDAVKLLGQAEKVRLELIRVYPSISAYRADLARIYVNLGVLARHHKEGEGLPNYKRAEMIFRQLVEAYPEVSDFRFGLASSCLQMGEIHQVADRNREALDLFNQARDLLRLLHRTQPSVTDYSHGLGKAHYSLGIVHDQANRVKEAAGDYQVAIEMLTKAVDADRTRYATRYELANAFNNLGLLRQRTAQMGEAQRNYEQARTHVRLVLKAIPEYTDAQVTLAGVQCNLGNITSQKRPAEALPYFAEAIEVLTPIHERQAKLDLARRYLRITHFCRALTLRTLGRHGESAADWAVVVRLETGPEKQRYRLEQAQSLLQAGEHDAGVAVVEDLAKDTALPPEALFLLARFYAVAARMAQAEAALPLPRRERRVETCARAALTLLEQAKKSGIFATPEIVRGLKQDEGFSALRGRAEFQAFVAGLEK